MRRGKTRFLAVLLSLALACSMSGVIAFAADDSSDDPLETPTAALAGEPETEGSAAEGETADPAGFDFMNDGTSEIQTNGAAEPAVIDDAENIPMTIDDDTKVEVRSDEEFLEAILDSSIALITLEEDIQVIMEDVEDHYQIRRDIVIDLNNHTITVDAPNGDPYASLFDIEGPAVNATIKNGTIDGKQTAYCYAVFAQVDEFTMENVEVIGFYGDSREPNYFSAVYYEGNKFTAINCKFNHNAGPKGLFCSGGAITIDGCEICDNTVTSITSYGVGMEILNAGKVSISNSVISNNKISTSAANNAARGGGCTIYGSSNITFYNNKIENNVAGTYTLNLGGGGIFLWDCAGSLLIDTNTISQNKAGGYGGGIYILNSGDDYILDTILIRNNGITYNTVVPSEQKASNGIYYALGGGVMIEDHSTHHNGTCIFSGNDISYNKALNDMSPSYGRGGGISLYGEDSGREFWIYSGTFYGNEAEWGGAIDFTSKESSALHLFNALITDNTAVRGGGIWLCPTSETTMYETLGGAIYGNSVTGEITSLWNDGNTYTYPATGDDIRYEGTDSDIWEEIRSSYDDDESLANSRVTVMERALGGELMEWYADDAATYYDHSTGQLLSSFNNRYHKEDKLETVNVVSDYTNRNTSFGLHGELDENGQALAKEEAEVIISGNSATVLGGGIASNSTIYFGIEEYTQLEIVKDWKDENGLDLDESTLPEEIHVTLVRVDEDGNKEDLETVALTAENDWSWTFAHLEFEYMTDEEGTAVYHPYTYEVREVEDACSEGYTPSYAILSDSGLSGNTDTIILAITNVPVTDTPEPEIPDEPLLPSTTQIAGRKIWDDHENEAGARPESITVRLYADGVEIRSQTVTERDSWRFSFTGLDLYDSSGHRIVYTVEEDPVEDYESRVEGNNITNTYIGEEPELMEIPVTKVWDDAEDTDGIRPDSIAVNLYRNGEPTDLTLILDESSGWSGTFTGLEEETDGEKNVWTVSELAVEGYESSVSGDPGSGFVITNTHTPDEREEPEEPVAPNVPEEPEIPQEPETPDEPQEPETPGDTEEPAAPEPPEEQGEQEIPGTPDEPGSPDSESGLPQTGFRWNLLVCIGMLVIAGMMLAAVGKSMMSTERRRRK